MLRKLICYKNKELGYYESIKPIENPSNEELKESCERYLKTITLDNKDLPMLIGREIVCVGTFDDATGALSSDPVVIVDCDEVLKERFPRLYEQAGNC